MDAALLAEFDRLRDYRTASGWNELVRVCEALAVAGWGDRAPVEAVAERWIDGSFYTELRDQRFRVVDGSAHRWSRRGGGFVREGGPDVVTATELHTQRILPAKNPVRFVRSGNVQGEAATFVAELRRLRDVLDDRLARPYGPGFGYVALTLAFSHPYDGPGLATEYFHDEIGPPAAPDARPFVRPRLAIGRLTTRRGEVVLPVTRHYTDAEARADLAWQTADFATDVHTILDGLAVKLRRRAPRYRVADLSADVREILGPVGGARAVSPGPG
ncbi:hypothetical protein [Actinoplanes sp. NPDC051494]|uniref:hypothetical protein n=1 Tax=Actinoplanes sp. NPDC051494 TaxID=3363907 RepID=UPI0037A2AF45